jgi:hypothetical protein
VSKRKIVWIPAVVAAAAALALIVVYLLRQGAHGEGGPPVRPPGGGAGFRRPEEGGAEGIFKTLGTVAVFVGAAAFCWFWFRKKLRSPSAIVRQLGQLLRFVHKALGWAALAAVAAHGIYFLLYKSQDAKIYSGLAAFAILLALAGYGFFINKVRNKWMRLVHRSLGVAWAPALLLHAGGSAIAAVASCLGAGALVWLLERYAPARVPAADKR